MIITQEEKNAAIVKMTRDLAEWRRKIDEAEERAKRAAENVEVPEHMQP